MTASSRRVAGPGDPGRVPSRPIVVGIGASAGGLAALQALFAGLPADTGLAFVVVSHHDPARPTLLSDLLNSQSPFSAQLAVDNVKLEANQIYVVPADSLARLEHGHLRLTVAPRREDRRAPIDRFFAALAHAQGAATIAIVLSGLDSDGALGLKAVSEAGGLTIAQEPETAEYPGMPLSALDSGAVDYTLAPEQIGGELIAYLRYRRATSTAQEAAQQETIRTILPEVCAALLARSGHDFHHYKHSTLIRRILRRLHVLQIASAREYVERMQQDPSEADQLLKELLINVTAFFRDPDAFDALSRRIIPKFFQNVSQGQGVRIWVPGCATGEEAYTIAILLMEEMDGLAEAPEVQLFATDIDADALDVARAGVYPLSIADHLSAQRLERFFVKTDHSYQVSKELRNLVVFSVHNVINDPPFSRLDLISCRNLLIYLGTYLQKKLIPVFHYALRPGGYLFLGPSENLNSYRDLFRTVDPKHRISIRVQGGKAPAGVFAGRSAPSALRPASTPPTTNVDTFFLMERITLEDFAPRTVVVDEEGRIICSSGNLDRYVTMNPGAFQNNLMHLAREGLRMGLRAALAEAVRSGARVTHDGLSLRTADGVQRVLITVQPLAPRGGESGLFHVVFQDIGAPIAATTTQASPNEGAVSLIEQLERELTGTREDLEHTVQDLEAANEELKSGNEELLSMNEELQSTNEELQASRDELVSSNDDLARANTDLENLLASTQVATIFLGADGVVRQVTPTVRMIYNMQPGDVGRPIGDFTHNAVTMPPIPPAETVYRASKPVEDEIYLTDGRWFLRRVLPYRGKNGAPTGIVMTFTDLTERKRAEDALAASARRFQFLAESLPQKIFTADPSGALDYVNPRWTEFSGDPVNELLGTAWRALLHPDDFARHAARWREAMERQDRFEVEHRLRQRDGSYRWHLTRAECLRGSDGSTMMWLGSSTDIDDVKRAADDMEVNRGRLQIATETAELGVFEWDLGVDEPTWQNQQVYEIFGMALDDRAPSKQQFLAETLHPDDAELFQRQLRLAMERPHEKFTVSCRIRRHDNGEWRWLEFAGRFAAGPDGQPERLVGVIADVSHRRRLEDDLRQFAGTLSDTDRRKDEFLATLAHELRNPLAPMRNALELMRIAAEPVIIDRARGMMDRQLHQLMRIVDDLLDVSRISKGKLQLQRERVTLRSVLDNALETSRPVVDQHAHQVELLLPDQDVMVDADPTRLGQVFTNLINNAAKYTPAAGRITVTATRHEQGVAVTISDNGIGIGPEMLSRVFDMFTQVDRSNNGSQGGLGIGLTLVRRLVELHGGSVEARSDGLGRGAAFTVRLPVVH
ncbi:MAG TPA: CheR family methyltransferase [Gemmatimonadales bacterium]|jgi:two-component system CheB/CheR fusion protein